jgi:hypothetical protein
MNIGSARKPIFLKLVGGFLYAYEVIDGFKKYGEMLTSS